MLDPADVLVHGHPVADRLGVEHASRVGRAAVAEEVPGGLHEGVHRVGLPAPLPPAAGAGRVHEGRHVGQRRAALAPKLDVAGEDHRQPLFALRHHGAAVAVDDGDRGAPVALAADPPVAQAVVDPGLADPLGDEPLGRLLLGRGDRQPVQEARVDLDPLARVRLAHPPRRALDRLDDRQGVLLGEVPVPLVLPRDRHDGARAVAHQHVVGQEERDLPLGEGVEGSRPEAQTPLGAVGRQALDFRLPGDLGAERLDDGALIRVGNEPVHQRVLGGEDRVGHPEGRVRPGREHPDRDARPPDDGQDKFRALRLPDPVALHREDPLGPAREAIAPGQELLGVLGDLEEPALDVLRDDLGLAPPAVPRLHLLVGQHRLAGGAPVDGGALAVGQPALEHPDEDLLLPLVVLGIAGGELPVPVVGAAHLLQLGPHVLDVLVGPHGGMDAVLDGRVLGGQPEGVPPHRVQHVEAPHGLVARHHVADGVVADVPHVDAPRGVGKHLQAVELGAGRVGRHLEGPGVFPDLLPGGFDLPEGIAVRSFLEGHISADFYHT